MKKEMIVIMGVGIVLGIIGLIGSREKRKERDAIRNSIQKAFDEKKITRTEYDLIWDLTTSGDLHLAKYYIKQALVNKEN